MQLNISIRNFRDRKQIFNKPDQPLGIVVNVRKNLFPCLIIQYIIAVQQCVGISGNRGQRRSQIVGNGTKEVGTKLFILCKNRSFFFFISISQAFQSQSALTKNRKKNAGCKCIRLCLFFHLDPDNSVNLLPGTNSKIQSFCLWKCFGRCSCSSSVLPYPVDHIRLLFIL